MARLRVVHFGADGKVHGLSVIDAGASEALAKAAANALKFHSAQAGAAGKDLDPDVALDKPAPARSRSRG
jgi:hypothetical protein